MFSKISGFWGFIGGTLALVALYLVLVNATGSEKVLGSGFSGYTNLIKTLQGR